MSDNQEQFEGDDLMNFVKDTDGDTTSVEGGGKTDDFLEICKTYIVVIIVVVILLMFLLYQCKTSSTFVGTMDIRRDYSPMIVKNGNGYFNHGTWC
jgi:hypothetical protein